MFSILHVCMHFFIAYQARIYYMAKLELSMWINVIWLLNQISVDIIWGTSFRIYKTIHNIYKRYSALLILMLIINFISILKPLNWSMSSLREVLITMLALLQRKTLIATKIRALKCLKMALFDCAINEKCLLTEDAAFALFYPYVSQNQLGYRYSWR